MAEDLIKRYNRMIDSDKSSAQAFYQMENINNAKLHLDMAQRFDPGNPKIREAKDAHDTRVKKNMAAFFSDIDKRKWPGHGSDALEKSAYMLSDKVSVMPITDIPEAWEYQ